MLNLCLLRMQPNLELKTRPRFRPVSYKIKLTGWNLADHFYFSVLFVDHSANSFIMTTITTILKELLIRWDLVIECLFQSNLTFTIWYSDPDRGYWIWVWEDTLFWRQSGALLGRTDPLIFGAQTAPCCERADPLIFWRQNGALLWRADLRLGNLFTGS